MRYIITALLASAPFASWAEVPVVVTDIPPVQSLVAQVMGDLGTPVLLLAKGADEHDFQLRPSQAGDVADAGLVVWIGPDLTPWLGSALANRPDGSATLTLLNAPGSVVLGHAATDDHDADEHDHDAGGVDLHAWLDPDNGKVWLDLIAAELSRLDPDNAATYAGNAATAATAIDRMDAEIVALLAPVKDQPIVTYHDAFGYFAAHYGLNIVGSIALGDASSPGAQRLNALRATLQSGGARCLFPEVQHDPALAAQLIEGTKVTLGGALDPVGSTFDPGPQAYGDHLRGIARTIADCLGG